MADFKDVSFVLPLFRSDNDVARLLARTLALLAAQSLRNVDVVLIAPGNVKEALLDVTNGVDLSVIWLEDGEHADLMTAASGQYLCFLTAGCEPHSSFAEKCGWFLATRPHLEFCNTLFATQDAADQPLAQDLSGGITWLRQYPHGTNGLFFRRKAVEQAVTEGWFLPDTGLLTGLLMSVAQAKVWGATLPEQLMVEAPDFHQRCNVPVVNLPENIHQPEAADFGAFADLPTAAVLNNIYTTDTGGSKNHLRILVILSWMTTGGADKFNLDLVEMLVAQGHHVTLCTTLPNDHPWEHRFAAVCDDVFVLDRFLPPQDIPRFLAYLIDSRQICTTLISGSTLGYQLLPYMRAMAPHVAFLDLCHVEEPHWQNGGHPRFSIGYGDMLDLNIVSTEHLSQWMAARGADPARIKVLYTGVEEHDPATIAQKRRTVRAELGLADDKPVIIYGGRICAQKRPLVLGKILHAISQSGQDFHALIIGDGDMRAEFEAAIKKHNLTANVTMFGSVDHQRWHDLLKASDVFLLPSEYEGISIALLEAMSAGVVPVVSHVGGQGEIVSKESGFLVKHATNEIEVYRDVIMQILGDLDLRQSMGVAAQEVICKTFSKRSTIKAFETYVAAAKEISAYDPRMVIPQRFGIETATTTLELSRLNAAFSWVTSQTQTSQNSTELMAMVNILLALRQSRFGTFLADNSILRGILRRVLRRR